MSVAEIIREKQNEESLEGKNVKWMEHVTDEEYAEGEDAG